MGIVLFGTAMVMPTFACNELAAAFRTELDEAANVVISARSHVTIHAARLGLQRQGALLAGFLTS